MIWVWTCSRLRRVLHKEIRDGIERDGGDGEDEGVRLQRWSRVMSSAALFILSSD